MPSVSIPAAVAATAATTGGISAGTAGLLAAGVGAAGSLAGGLLKSSGANSAGQVAADTSKYAADLQQQRFDQVRNDLMPYTNTGVNAQNRLSRIFGLGGDPGAPYPGQPGTSTTMPTYGQPPAPGPGQNPRGPMPVPPTQPQAGGGGGPQYTSGGIATGGFLPEGWRLVASGGGENGPQGMVLLNPQESPVANFTGPGVESQAQQWLTENKIPLGQQGVSGGGGAGGVISPQAQAQYDQQLAQYQQDLAAYNTPNSLSPLQQANLYAPLPGYGSAVTPYAAPNNGVFTFDQSNLQNAPGFQFQLDQAKRAADASAAARGGLQSGAALKAAEAYGNGLATTNWQNQLAAQQGIFGTNLNSSIALNNQYYDKNINPLFQLAQSGQNAATQVGNQGIASAATQGALINAGGQFSAAGQLSGSNALGNSLAQAGSQIGKWVGSTYGNQPNNNLPSGDFSNGGNYDNYTTPASNFGSDYAGILGGGV